MLWARAARAGGRAQKSAQARFRLRRPKGGCCSITAYRYTCNGFVYSFGAAILDIDKPWKVLYRCGNYLLTPEKQYETVGFVPNVTFPCANIYDADTGRIAIYYGAADTCTAIAFAQVDEVIDYIKNNSRSILIASELS